MADFSCALAITVLVGPEYKKRDRLILGHAFFNSFNLTLKYDQHQIGFTGGLMGAAADKSEGLGGVAIAAMILVLTVAGGLGYYVVRRKRAAALAKGLNEVE
jgi:hypothetical protein